MKVSGKQCAFWKFTWKIMDILILIPTICSIGKPFSNGQRSSYPKGTPCWRIDLHKHTPLKKKYMGEFNRPRNQHVHVAPNLSNLSLSNSTQTGPTKLPNPLDSTLHGISNGDSETGPQPSHMPQCWYPSQSSNPAESSCQTSLGEKREDRTILQETHVYLSTYLSIHLSIYPSIHLSIHLSIYLSIHLSNLSNVSNLSNLSDLIESNLL